MVWYILFIFNLCYFKFDFTNKVLDNIIRLSNQEITDAFDNDYYASILIELNYDKKECSNELYMEENFDSDNYLRRIRKEMKDYYFLRNEKIAKKLGLLNYNYCLSYFSPYIEIVFNDVNEYNTNKGDIKKKLENNEYIKSVVIDLVKPISLSDDRYYECDEDYPLETAFSDIGVANTQFSGAGIRIGFIDTIMPLDDDNFYPDMFDYYYQNSDDENDEQSEMGGHCEFVASIAGGMYGIAKDAHLYFYSTGSNLDIQGNAIQNSYIYGFNWLIDTCNVNIINISMYFTHDNGNSEVGVYEGYSEYCDYIVSTTKCTIIKSAGNNGNGYDEDENLIYMREGNNLITAPGLGLNVITVGSINIEKKLSYFSSRVEGNEYTYKPDLVAPGENICNIPNFNGSRSGTSFSAPMVTGIVALLMEEFPILKASPSIVKAVLLSGCVKLDLYDDMFDDDSGFGLVNYINSRNCILNQNYFTFRITDDNENGDILYTSYINIPAHTMYEAYITWTINTLSTDYNSTDIDANYSKCKISLYNVNNECVRQKIINSNMNYISYYNNTDNELFFTIKVHLNGNKVLGGIEYCAVAHSYEDLDNTFVNTLNESITHTHKYNYEINSISNTQHTSTCVCGETVTSGHVVKNSSTNSKQCIVCGVIVNTNDDIFFPIFPTSLINIMSSPNGSYILPNGIIVLVEEDIDLYFNGTLKFSNNRGEIK